MARETMAVVVVLFYYLLVAAPHATKAAITCDQLVSNLAPCATYLVSGGTVSAECCNGAKSLQSVAKTTDDRQTACRCAEHIATMLPGVNFDYARALPSKCGINFPYQISPSTDCSKVH